MRFLLFSLMLLFSSLSFAADNGQMPPEQQLAINYIKALTEHDYDTLENFYSRESVFTDATAGRTYVGGRHIIEFFERAHRGVLEYDFNIEHMFNTGSLVVMIGNYHFKGPGEQFGKPGKVIDIAIPGVTTLNVDVARHRVNQHLDYIDYQTMADQLAAQ
ncbi:nuclear transport factor 2 family protein [Shewanella electrica]|uniref:nuclear transport factor 2 family protein n=1 Tax=Shewanella electrica TaxID=515560 RepID=UPI003F69A16F